MCLSWGPASSTALSSWDDGISCVGTYYISAVMKLHSDAIVNKTRWQMSVNYIACMIAWLHLKGAPVCIMNAQAVLRSLKRLLTACADTYTISVKLILLQGPPLKSGSCALLVLLRLGYCPHLAASRWPRMGTLMIGYHLAACQFSVVSFGRQAAAARAACCSCLLILS